MPQLPSSVQQPLLSCSSLLAQKARLALLTLLILMGVTLGLWQARPASGSEGATATTRSGASNALCKHASIAFAPNLSVQSMSQVLRAEDAYILYGPDEFGEYHLRFASHVNVAPAITRLQSQAGVSDVIANPHCL